MLKYAKHKGGSKSKRKGSPKRGTIVAAWRPCNQAHDARGGEFINAARTRLQMANGEIPRGHVHLPNCECLKAADWPDGYSEEYRGMLESEKAHGKRIAAHEQTGTVCGECFLLIPVSGAHTCW